MQLRVEEPLQIPPKCFKDLMIAILVRQDTPMYGDCRQYDGENANARMVQFDIMARYVLSQCVYTFVLHKCFEAWVSF